MSIGRLYHLVHIVDDLDAAQAFYGSVFPLETYTDHEWSDHDKRLTQVDVRVRENLPGTAGLAFSIRAKLLLNPSVEPVSFDAVLQPGSNRYSVTKAARPAPEAA